jgi:collagenase-like PrtC family protease
MAIEELNNKRSLPPYEVVINDFDELQDEDVITPPCISLLARNEEQIKCALDNHIDRIYVTDKFLYNKYKEETNRIYFRCYRVKDNTNDRNTLCTELGSLYRNRTIGDYFLNVSNHATLDYLSKYSELLTLSTELELNEVKDIMQYYNFNKNVELVIYNYPELMITKYCLLNKNINKNEKCHVCMDNYKYYLMDRNNCKYRILTDFEIHLTHILNYQAIDKIEDIKAYKNMGINNFRIELLDENYNETLNIIRRVKDSL